MEPLESRFAGIAARIGALELLMETLLGKEIAADPALRIAIDDLADPGEIRKDLHLVSDPFMKDRILLIHEVLRERVQGALRQAARFQ